MKSIKTKQRLLIILRSLQNLSHEHHPLSTSDLSQICYDQGIPTERRAIYDDIATLCDLGYDILQVRLPKHGYFLASQHFEQVELKLLMDAIISSSFISKAKTNQLIDKIANLTNIYDRKQLLQRLYYPQNKQQNEQIFYHLDTIQTAIAQKKAISFQYFDMSIKGQKKYRKQAKRYHLIPYTTVWNNQRYYCIGYHQKHHHFINFRIDKMDHIHIEEDAIEIPELELNTYLDSIFNMYQGEKLNVVLQVDLSLANVIFDQFGYSILISEVNDTHFVMQTHISIAPTFISWIFQFSDRIKVLQPQSLIDEVKKTAQAVLSQY